MFPTWLTVQYNCIPLSFFWQDLLLCNIIINILVIYKSQMYVIWMGMNLPPV
jgi:hypothetical protein